MAERGITEDDIHTAVKNAHMTNTTQSGGMCFIGRTASGKVLKVFTLPFRPGQTTAGMKSAAWKDE